MEGELAAKIAIVGDYNSNYPSHPATNVAIDTAARALGADVSVTWVTTPDIASHGPELLDDYDGVWASPGSPYKSLDGMLSAIRFARERNKPLVATWGGFQHVLVEYARNVLGMADARHAEYGGDPSTALITLSTCAVPSSTEGGPRLDGALRVSLAPDSGAARIYGRTSIDEEFHCNYALNPIYESRFDGADLRIVGTGPEGEARVIELAGATFFIGTLFLPQMAPSSRGPHPLIRGIVETAIARK